MTINSTILIMVAIPVALPVCPCDFLSVTKKESLGSNNLKNTNIHAPKNVMQSKTLILFAAIASSGLIAASASAASITMVDFGNTNYIPTNSFLANTNRPTDTATGDFDFDGTADDTATYVANGTTWTPPSSAGWTTPSGKNGPGLLWGTALANLNFATAPTNRFGTDAIRDNSGSESIQAIPTSTAVATQQSMTSAFYYTKSSFLNGLNVVSNLSFSSGSNMSFDLNVSRGSNAGQGRFLVQDGTQWYVSASSINFLGSTLSIDPYASTFYAINLTGASLGFFNSASPGSDVSGSTFTNIQGFGVQMQHLNYAGASAFTPYELVKGFSATAVPEPSAWALLVGGLTVLVAFRRRRAQSKVRLE
jgi:hypothetical protein